MHMSSVFFLTEKTSEQMLIFVLLGCLQASAFEGSVFTHSDVKPGMLVKAKVLAVENFGAIVQFSSGVKALCPLPHMSEFDIVKPDKKFKVWFCFIFSLWMKSPCSGIIDLYLLLS